jgi:hypothetical protein
MRGSPLIRALLAFLVLLALGIPLRRLIEGQAQELEKQPTVESGNLREIELRLEFTTPATGLKVLHLGQEVWSEAAPGAELSRKLTLPYPKEGVELEFKLHWPEGKLCAARVQVSAGTGEVIEKSLFGQGEVEEVLSFP